MKKTRIWSFLLIALLVLSVFPLHIPYATADKSTPTIEKPVYITITDEKGTPVSGATVQVLDANGDVVEMVETADDTFSVFLPAGAYTLKITKAPNGYLPVEETVEITVELTEAEEKDDIEADTFPSTLEAHKIYCKHNPSHLETYKVFDEGEVTAYCFNQNYDPPTRETPAEGSETDNKYKRLVGTPDLLYSLAQCKWLGPDGEGISAQELYDHVVSMIYHRDEIQEKYGFDDLLVDYIINMAIKQYTDGEMRSFKTTDEDGKNLVVREYYPNGPIVYDENGYYQFRPGGSVLGSIVGHANGANAGNSDYVFPQEFRDAWAELLAMTDHPDDYYLYIYYPHNFMTKEEGVASGWHVPSHYDPMYYYYADAFQCLLSTFTVEPIRATLKVREVTEIEITKTWADENDLDGYRPSAAAYTRMVKLFADGADVTNTYANGRKVIDNGDNTYTVRFENLRKYTEEGTEIAYTIRETDVDKYTADQTEAANGGTITNTHIPETEGIPIRKIWDDDDDRDGLRPDHIIIRLLADGVVIDTVEIKPDEDGNWSYTFTDLDKRKSDGTLIVYTVEEETVTNYETTIEGYTVKNKHTPETVDIPIVKEWDDNDNAEGARPESVTVNLIADGKKVKSATVTPNENGYWTYTFTDLPKYRDHGTEIVYTVEEEPVPEYTASIDGFRILNTYKPEMIEIPVEKVWDDDDDRDGLRPDHITVRLLADGEVIDTAEITPDEDGNWAYTFTDLKKRNANGTEIVYTVEEETVAQYETIVEASTITNRHTAATVEIPVRKEWKDNDDAAGVRPESIIVNLLADGEVIDSVEIEPDENGDWEYTFTDLPICRDHGTEIVYTIEEEAVEHYTTTIDGFTVINEYVPETVDVEGKKTWDDNNDHDKLRPTKITIVLYADGEEIDSVTVTEADGWKWSWKDLPKYKDGKEIRYTIKEKRVSGYIASINGYDITNTYAPPTDDTEQPVLWIVLLALSVLAGVALLILERMYVKNN